VPGDNDASSGAATAAAGNTRSGGAERFRAAIYLRVSTAGQVDGTSIDSQREQCRAAATRHGCTVVGEYVDAGVSGAKAARPALDELVAAATAGEVDVVVIAKLDRLGRSLLHLLTLIGQLDALGVRVVSASDNIDTKTPAGRMMLQLLGVFAEFERERIRERSRDGARRRVADGGFVSSSPPFGYRAVPDPSGRRGVVLAIDPAQAACIREVYRLLVHERTTVSRAARALNEAGHRSASGAEWTKDTLLRWARGEGPATAAGTYRWNDLTVDIPPILTGQQHREWAAWKADTAQPQRDRGAYLLGGLARTPCGRYFHGRTAGSQTPVYACRRRLTTNVSDPNRCGCLSIPIDTLDDAVWSQIRAALTRPGGLAALAGHPAGTSQLDIGGHTLNARIAATADTIAGLQQAIAAEYQAARDDGYDAATARMMIAPLHADLKRAQGDLARLSKVRAAITTTAGTDGATPDPRQTIDRARLNLDNLDLPGKHQVLDTLAVTVQVTGYRLCDACGGTGYQPTPPGHGRHWPAICATCRRMGKLPEVTVQIGAPEALLALGQDTREATGTAG
jgi:site-specific DNA recombinase